MSRHARSLSHLERVHPARLRGQPARVWTRRASYGIQDLGAALVSEVHGSYSSVVGLPAAETLELLEALGVLEAWP